MGRMIRRQQMEMNFDELDKVCCNLKQICQKAGKNASKEKLMAKLKLGLKNYKQLGHPAISCCIKKWISEQSRKICAVPISEQELDELVNTTY